MDRMTKGHDFVPDFLPDISGLYYKVLKFRHNQMEVEFG